MLNFGPGSRAHRRLPSPRHRSGPGQVHRVGGCGSPDPGPARKPMWQDETRPAKQKQSRLGFRPLLSLASHAGSQPPRDTPPPPLPPSPTPPPRPSGSAYPVRSALPSREEGSYRLLRLLLSDPMSFSHLSFELLLWVRMVYPLIERSVLRGAIIWLCCVEGVSSLGFLATESDFAAVLCCVEGASNLGFLVMESDLAAVR
jgi:hypothetical protein